MPMSEVVVLARDARAHGLPPIALRLRAPGMVPFAFPDASSYLSLSGPPGGVLFLQVKRLGHGPVDLDRLRELVAGNDRRPVTFGSAGHVTIGGVERDAVLFYVGESMAATAGCALAVPAGHELLLVVLGIGGNPRNVTSCSAVAGQPSLRAALDSFEAVWRDVDEEAPAPDPQPAATPAATTPPSPGWASTPKASLWAKPEPDPEPEPESVPEPEPEPAGVTGAQVLALLDRVKAEMRRIGCWAETAPTAESYAAQTPLQQLLWSLQSTLDMLEPSLRGAIGTEMERGLAPGLHGMLASWKGMLVAEPQAAGLVALLPDADA